MYILILSTIFILQTRAATTQGPVFYSKSQMARMGTKMMFSSLRSSLDPVLESHISYSDPIPSPTDKLVGIASVTTFDCLASTQFSWNATCSDVTYTDFSLKIVIMGNTYVNKMKFNFLVMAWNNGYLVDMLVASCFLTNQLSVITAKRSQIFTEQPTLGLVTNGSITKVQSFITGLKFFNNKDASKRVSVKSYIVDNGLNITHEVEVSDSTILEWICIGTVIIQSDQTIFSEKQLPFQLGALILDRVSASIEMASFPFGYTTKYSQMDTKFFGLIQIQMHLGKPFQIVQLLTENVISFQLEYSILAVGGKMAYFFFSSRACDPTFPNYSINKEKCYSGGCPDGEIKSVTADICIPCHYSCLTCSGATSSDCLTCNQVGAFRKPMSSGKCNCADGYVQNNTQICTLCSLFIKNCVKCNSKTDCTQCVSPIFQYVYNSTINACICPINSMPYYVEASVVCAPYPGCIDAEKNTNFIYCKTCDDKKNFYLTSTRDCKCKPYFILSSDTCIDNCGDGYNPFPNTTYCDDGNQIDGDGCSRFCSVQTPDFGCFNPPSSNRSVCSQAKNYTVNFLYTQRVIDQNAGVFSFEVSPSDSQLAASGFKYYVETSIPHKTAIGTYDPITSILRIKIIYQQSIESQIHDIKVQFDPYKMWAQKKNFTIKAQGVNYDLTIDQNVKFNLNLWYISASISGLVVITSLIINFVNYKIAATQLLLSSQVIFLAVLAWINDNGSIYPMTGLKFLAGYNVLKQFQVNKYNSGVPFLLPSSTFAQFLLNFNFMGAVIVLVILIVIPLKINVLVRTYMRNRYTSPQMQQKLANKPANTSLSELSSKIKTAQYIADTYVDRVYFGFSLIVFLPIVVYFSIQLGFIGKVGRYELSSFANIMASILLLMLDFCFLILVFLDTDKKLKMFNFGSKKLKSYPNRLIMFYFAACCLFTIVLLCEYTFYILFGMTLITGIYVFIENPFNKLSFQYVDSVSKPLIALICQAAVKATQYFSNQVIFIPIAVSALLFISTIMTIARVVKIKFHRAEVAKKMLEDAQNDDNDEDIEFEKKLKSTENQYYKIDKKFDQSRYFLLYDGIHFF